VTHAPNSGWAGRPRNAGTDLACFSHVFYCDADDWLLEHALEILLERAQTDRSDIVVGRAVGNQRSVPRALFERGDYCTDWRRTPGVFNNLTIQKLFRREFLRERGLRFAEGRVRLEDFLFMTQAFLQAERISIVGSRPGYVFERRADRGNLTATAPEHEDYYRSVERLIDIIEANTAEGRERDIALDRVLRAQLIRHASSAHFLQQDLAERERVFARVGRTLRERIPPSAEARLDARTRYQAAAIRRGDREFVERWSAWDAAVRAQVALLGTGWDGARLRVDLSVGFERHGEVVRLLRSGERLVAPGPPASPGDGTPQPDAIGGIDVTDELPRAAAFVKLRSRDISEEWRVRAEITLRPDAATPQGVALQWTATAAIDFATVAGGHPLRPGVWDVQVEVAGCGLQGNRALTCADVEVPPPAVAGALVVIPFRTGRGLLSLDIDQWTRSLAAEVVRRGVGRATTTGGTATIPLDLVVAGATPRAEVHLLPTGRCSTPPQILTGTVTPSPGTGSTLVVELPRLASAPRWSLRFRFGGPGSGPTVPLGLGLDPPARWQRSDAPVLRPRRVPTATRRDDMTTKLRAAIGTGWRHRAVTVARRMGLKVVRVRSGTALVSRSESYDVTAVLPDEAYAITRRRTGAATAAVKLKRGLALVAGQAEAAGLHTEALTDDAWLVTTGSTAGSAVEVAPIGARGWLVARRDESPTADLHLETETMQHLATRHIAWLLKRYRIDCVLDVGANNGQYALGLRRNGYRGHILSFEPVPKFAEAMQKLAADDEKWTVYQLALGSTEGTVPIRVQRTFSSVLASSDYGKKRFATLRDFADTEQIEVPLRRLDHVFDEFVAPLAGESGALPRVFLKMDTQGFDLEVFRGLGNRAQDVLGLQSEVALLLIYEHMPRMPEALATYEAAGFELTGLYPVTRERDGRIIEYDCTMVRASAL
jgi:FkbM family methyltransferase